MCSCEDVRNHDHEWLCNHSQLPAVKQPKPRSPAPERKVKPPRTNQRARGNGDPPKAVATSALLWRSPPTHWRWEQYELHCFCEHIWYRGTRPSFLAVVLTPPTFVVLVNTVKLKQVSKQTSVWWRERILSLPIALFWCSNWQQKKMMASQRNISFLKHWYILFMDDDREHKVDDSDNG